MDSRDGFRITGDKNRHRNGSNLDFQVEEAVKKLTQRQRPGTSGQRDDLPVGPSSSTGGGFQASRRERERRLKSLPGDSSPLRRLYDWNTTHFYPDQHEVNVGLTFEVPHKGRSFDGDGYFLRECANSEPTYISVSREGSATRIFRSSGGSGADSSTRESDPDSKPRANPNSNLRANPNSNLFGNLKPNLKTSHSNPNSTLSFKSDQNPNPKPNFNPNPIPRPRWDSSPNARHSHAPGNKEPIAAGPEPTTAAVPDGDSDEDSFCKVWQRSPVRRRKKAEEEDRRPVSTEFRTEGLPPRGSPGSHKKGRSFAEGVAREPFRGQRTPCSRGAGGGVDLRSTAIQAGSPKLSGARKMADQTRSDFQSSHSRRQRPPDNPPRPSEAAVQRPRTSEGQGRPGPEPERAAKKKKGEASTDGDVKRSSAYSALCLPGPASRDSSLDYRLSAEERERLRCQGYEIEQDSPGSASADDYVYVLKRLHGRPASAQGRELEGWRLPERRRVSERFEAEEEGDGGGGWNVLQEDRMVRESRRDGADQPVRRGPPLERDSGARAKYHAASSGELLSRPGCGPRRQSASDPRTTPGGRGEISYRPVGRSGQPGSNLSWERPPESDMRRIGATLSDSDSYGSTVFGLTGYSTGRFRNEGASDTWSGRHGEGGGGNADLRRKPIAGWLELGSDLERALASGCRGEEARAYAYPRGRSFSPTPPEERRLPPPPHLGRETYGQEEEEEEREDAVGLIFDAIDQRDNYSSQSEIIGLTTAAASSSLGEAVYSKPQKRRRQERRHKTQDRFEDLIFLDLHAQSKLEAGAWRPDEEAPSRIVDKPTRPTGFAQPFGNSVDPKSRWSQLSQHEVHGPIRRYERAARPAFDVSCSLPGSKENLRWRRSSSEEDGVEERGGGGRSREPPTVAEIKTKLFGANEERAESLLRRRPGSKNRSAQALCYEARPWLESTRDDNGGRSTFDQQGLDVQPSDDSDDDDAGWDRTSPTVGYGRRLELREMPSDGISSLARKDLDDMASRRFGIGWGARSNPDLSQRQSGRGGPARLQTSYPRRSSRTASREKLSRSSQTVGRQLEPKARTAGRSSERPPPHGSISGAETTVLRGGRQIPDRATAPSPPATRRQSLCAGVAKLVDLFERSSSAPNLLEENLFADSYSNAGDPLPDRDEPDLADRGQSLTNSSNSRQESGSRYKKSKKVKIRLLKSSDSGYIESETDSLGSSGKDSKDRKEGAGDLGKGNADEKSRERGNETDRKYDGERRSRELKQIREEWLNASPSQSPDSFVSKKVLPLDRKTEASFRRQESFSRPSDGAPYYERTCTVTSFGRSNYSAFAKPLSKPPQPQHVSSKDGRGGKGGEREREKEERGGGREAKDARGMSLLAEKGPIRIPVMSKAEPILASKFPSGFIPEQKKDRPDAHRSCSQRSVPERFELSDDGNLTDCTDVTIDAILARNQFGTLSPASTLDCSDFEFFQSVSGAQGSFPGSPKALGGGRAEVTGVSLRRGEAKPPCKAPLRKAVSDASAGSRACDRKSIKDLVDSFEMLLNGPFSGSNSKPAAVST